MTKRAKPSLLTLTTAQSRSLGTWVFGFLLFVFFVCVFAFAPKELPEFKQRMLAVASALLAGLFAFFLTGDIGIVIKPFKSQLGTFSVKAGGGVAVFVLVLWWWLSPWAPVSVEKRLTALEDALREQTRTLSYLSTEVHRALQTPTPSAHARELAAQIPPDADAYALALKAMAENRPDDARVLLEQAEKASRPEDRTRIYSARGRTELFAGQ